MNQIRSVFRRERQRRAGIERERTFVGLRGEARPAIAELIMPANPLKSPYTGDRMMLEITLTPSGIRTVV